MTKVLGLCSYPFEAAATRYRLSQFISPLADEGIELKVSPFLNKEAFAILYSSGQNFRKIRQVLILAGKRLLDFFKTEKFDAILIQREAMILGPPLFEWLYKKIGQCPLILDLDDATYLSYVSPTYGHLGSFLKFFGKTDTLIAWSETVICGNEHIAEYVRGKGKSAIVVPTVVDTNKFHPIESPGYEVPIIGWIGTHSTFPLLARIFPILQDLSNKYDFVLKVVGSGQRTIELDGMRVETLDWSLDRETADFQSLDIGLYPLEAIESVSQEWLAGKSGFKAIQYMAVGIPFVVTPIGVCSKIGIENETHFAALTKDQWFENLAKLLESTALRKKMGRNGREYALKHYSVPQQTEKIATLIKKTITDYKLKSD